MRLGAFVIVIFAVLGLGNHAQAQVACPAGYIVSGGQCIPDLPSSDFGFVSNYPVCGAGRVALSGDGDYTWSNFSSSHEPRSSTNYNWTEPSSGWSQLYSKLMSTDPSTPVYGYPPGTRCYCISTGLGTDLANSPAVATYSPYPSMLTNGGSQVPRFNPVTYDVISSQDFTASQRYGPVPIDISPTTDGRLYGQINGGAAANCACPNVNEQAAINGTDTVAGAAIGSYCKPMVNSNTQAGYNNQSPRVFVDFSPAVHSGLVMSGAWEPVSGGNVVANTLLPHSGGDQGTLYPYQRKIWTCASPYELDTGSRDCVFAPTHHMCDDGTPAGSIPSPVSDQVTGGATSQAVQFNNTVNKKLACCLNSIHVSGVSDTYEKFDCIDNSTVTYTSFNDLWSSTDPATDGGQMNALMLSDSVTSTGPRLISGFYSLNGQRCKQFSEFAFLGPIKHYRVDPLIRSSQQDAVGATPVYFGTDIPIPYNATFATNVQTKLGLTYPNAAADYRSCPILVRAAIVAACPAQTLLPNVLTSVVESGTTPAGPRCSAASGIQIHIRIEQVYEITGFPVIKPVDTLMEANQTTSLDVTSIIQQKVGDLCPPGTNRKADRCAY